MFEKGQSGNPAGRPPGVKDRRVAMRELLTPHASDLVAKVVELAKNGDTAALRICIDRLIPPVKAKDDPVALPALTDSPAENARVVVSALGAGELTPEEAGSILQVLTSQVRVIEADDIERRLAALEQSAGTKR
jgi:hypothetical protein